MFTTKNRRSLQLVYQLTAIIMIILLVVSCGRNIPSGKSKPDDEGKPGAKQDVGSDMPGPAATAAESFAAYSKAKGDLVTVLTDALASNAGTEMNSMSLLGVALVDLAVIPASCFGLGEEAATTALGLMDLEDIVYSENGNQYSVKYKNAEGEQYELQGVYDKAADALRCTSLFDGKESLIWEYRKTSFGYVGQFYVINEDGVTYVYKLAVSGKDGAFGISEASAAPPALTGSETIDFPKQSTEWYAIKGDAVTGATADGKEISFVYTPSENGE